MKTNTSSYFFLRAAALLIGGILLLALVLDFLLLRLASPPANDPAEQFHGDFALIETILDAPADPAPVFTARQPEIMAALGVPVTLHNQNEFAGLGADISALSAGEIITLFDNEGLPIYYRQLAQTDYLIAIGPVPLPVSAGINPQFVTWVYYLLVGLLILLWARPFYRDLDRLRSASLQFGRNDFSARVAVAPDSRILPVAQSFNAMAERIETLVSSHRELTNAVSHELRTPLARFKFSMEILARTEDEKKKEDYLSNMKQDVEELEILIDEMLSYAKLNEQNLLMELVEIDLKPWLEDIVKAYRHEHIHVSVSFSPATQSTFRATVNPDLMARAINNILRNCLRYASTGISIQLEQRAATNRISISDDGLGIPAEKLASIFEPFTRGDTSRDRESGGYGLGLAIAARILQRHQGSIDARNLETLETTGACFSIAWPTKIQ